MATPPPFLHPFARPAATEFVTIVRGEGAVVWDDEGREYIDAVASLWYCNVGHGRAEIVDAVAGQMRRLEAFHTFERFTNEAADALAATLAGLAPFPEARVFFTSGGSEAVDSAIKLSRIAHAVAGHAERTVVVGRTGSYHGVTFGGLSASGLAANRERFGPLLGDFVEVPAHDLDALDDVLEAHRGRVAAVLAEPVMGAGGVHPPAPGELEGLRERCDAHGAHLVADEVICGFGRLGHWWGMQHYGVVPDLVTFAKGVSSGYLPLGGVLLSRPVAEALAADPELVLRHGHTYSGHPATCAAGSANIGIIEREGLLERGAAMGARLGSGLGELAEHPAVAGVRGAGAVWGVGLADGVSAFDVRERMMAGGVLPRPLGPATLAFCPPLVTTDEQVDRCVEVLAAALP
jgi:putrescine---pyruvate transaminase